MPHNYDGISKAQEMVIKHGSTVTKGIALFIAGTSILDFAKKRQDQNAQNKEKEEQLKELKKQSNRENKVRKEVRREFQRQRKFSYSELNLGQTVIDAFNDRTGHHKMGNSKF